MIRWLKTRVFVFIVTSAPFAAGHAYHALNRFEEAYAQFKIAANDTRLANTRIGKVSKLMLARYILSYVPLNHDEGQEMTIPSVGKVTKQQAFQDLYRLATVDEFAPSFYWLGKKEEFVYLSCFIDHFFFGMNQLTVTSMAMGPKLI